MSNLKPIIPWWLWIILHVVQNVFWFWFLKWGGLEWTTGSVRGNKWNEGMIDAKNFGWVIVVFLNIIGVYGIFDPYIRWVATDPDWFFSFYLGFALFLFIIGLKIYEIICAYIEYRKQEKH